MRNVRMTIWVMVASLYLINSMALADCPPADLTGNCKVDFADFAVMASEWLAGGVPEGEGLNFGKLVVERIYVKDNNDFADFVKDWLDGTGETTNAELMYRDIMGSDVRRVSFFRLRPTSYYTISQGFYPVPENCQDYSIEHVEFSVDHVDIESLGGDEPVSSVNCTFELFGGLGIDFLSVKPPEIYFGVEVQSPQSFDDFHVNVGFCGQTDITTSGMGWTEHWRLVEGGGINIEYFRGIIREAKGEDVTLHGHLLNREGFVNWMNSWIDGLEPPQDIEMSYNNYYQRNFINAMPTSYILPTVNNSPLGPSQGILQESFSFTYGGIEY